MHEEVSKVLSQLGRVAGLPQHLRQLPYFLQHRHAAGQGKGGSRAGGQQGGPDWFGDTLGSKWAWQSRGPSQRMPLNKSASPPEACCSPPPQAEAQWLACCGPVRQQTGTHRAAAVVVGQGS